MDSLLKRNNKRKMSKSDFKHLGYKRREMEKYIREQILLQPGVLKLSDMERLKIEVYKNISKTIKRTKKIVKEIRVERHWFNMLFNK